MCFESADGLFEFLRGTLPYYTIAVIPLLIVISPMTPVLGAHEFTVYRMQQFDLASISHGSRSSLINMEAKTLYTIPLVRRCVVSRLAELTYSRFQDLIQQSIGGLLILLPQNVSIISEKEQARVMELEKSILDENLQMPVYFAYESEEILDMYYSMERSPAASPERRKSAAEELLNTIMSSGYQLVISGSQPTRFKDIQIASIHGKLSGFGVEEQLPTVAIVAHYDAFGIAPALSFGADSNGSGVAAILELARLISRLYTNSRSHPRFNLVFMLSGGGKFNYQGTKKWIEDNVDGSDGSLLPEALFTLCLDSIGSGDDLYLHVSKPPKEGSAGDIFFKELQTVSMGKINISLIHKKINLAEEQLAWEHERFSIRRLPAFTLSRLQSPKMLSRNSIFDTRDSLDIEKLTRNVRILGEALSRLMYNISGESVSPQVFTRGLDIQEDYLKSWVDYLTSQPRGAQLLVSNAAKNGLVSSLEQAMTRYLKDVKVLIFKPDKREPELAFYDPIITEMNAYRVKPAIFDLFLAAVIGLYLGFIYLLVTNFVKVEAFVKHHTKPLRPKQN